RTGAGAGGYLRTLGRRRDTTGHEVKPRPAVHGDRRTRVVREDEHRQVIRRLVAPPSSPTLIRPWTTHGSEHVAPENPRADVFERLGSDVVIDARFAAIETVHPTPDLSLKKPLEEFRPVDTERMIKILIRTGAVAINGHRETQNTDFRHRWLPDVL